MKVKFEDIGYDPFHDVDELAPDRGNMSEEIIQDCGIMCYLTIGEV